MTKITGTHLPFHKLIISTILLAAGAVDANTAGPAGIVSNLDFARAEAVRAKDCLMEAQHGRFTTWYSNADPLTRTFQIDALIVRLAGLREKALGQEPNTLTRQEREAGWKLLWDGKSTKGWRAIYLDHFPESGWIIEDGQLICLGEELPVDERGGAIITTEKYGSFELSFEFKIREHANSGVKYFLDESLKASMGHGLGLEFAILDDGNFPYPEKDAKRTCGSLYDLVKAEPGATRPVGEWNQGRIVVAGNHIEHWLNGKRVVEIEKGTPHYYNLVSNSKYKNIEGWGEFPEGHILLQDEGPRTAFRNIKIRKLDGIGR